MNGTMDITQAQAWTVIIVGVLGALGTFIVSIINVIRSKSNGEKLDSTDKKLDEIHVQTNSNLTALKADMVVANNEILFLKEYISKMALAPPDPNVPPPEFIAKIEIAEPKPT